MLRIVSAVIRASNGRLFATSSNASKSLIGTNVEQTRSLVTFSPRLSMQDACRWSNHGTLLSEPLTSKILSLTMPTPTLSRTLTKFSLRKGKRKAVKPVIKRFYRLDWGIWIRTMAGRHKRMWLKSRDRKRRMRKHVFTNATQSWLLDKMVTKFWKKRRHYPEDPYEPYHLREEYHKTRKYPAPIPEKVTP
ncbi:39S ribosomal protein L35, mitochondrial [Orussus abietinus]|uniref:39S ribosomal protein L35, mitochondrial n=1 Tax=Orussus abietinus TaxID=222816 RepID=UPI000626DF27|nr:39S ribosomal protein L35, mitochondrial [Orussus abietinus]